jgi:hypothetical protein
MNTDLDQTKEFEQMKNKRARTIFAIFPWVLLLPLSIVVVRKGDPTTGTSMERNASMMFTGDAKFSKSELECIRSNNGVAEVLKRAQYLEPKATPEARIAFVRTFDCFKHRIEMGIALQSGRCRAKLTVKHTREELLKDLRSFYIYDASDKTLRARIDEEVLECEKTSPSDSDPFEILKAKPV